MNKVYTMRATHRGEYRTRVQKTKRGHAKKLLAPVNTRINGARWHTRVPCPVCGEPVTCHLDLPDNHDRGVALDMARASCDHIDADTLPSVQALAHEQVMRSVASPRSVSSGTFVYCVLVYPEEVHEELPAHGVGAAFVK